MEREYREKSIQNSKLKEKVEQLRDLTDQMRFDYSKELNHYKEQEKHRRKTMLMVHQAHLAVDDEEDKIAIPVDFFDSLLGLDEAILKLVNEKIA